LPPDNFVPFQRPVEPMFFAGVELDFVWPHLHGTLEGNARASDGVVDHLSIPTVNVGNTVAPQFFLGYRLPCNHGDFLVAWRFLSTDGRGTVFDDSLGTVLDAKTRLSINQIDLDYRSPWLYPGGLWQWRYTIGARVGTAFFDTRLTDPFTDVRASSDFV